MCLANIKWNSNLLGYWLFSYPCALCWCEWILVSSDYHSCWWNWVSGPSAPKFSAEYVFVWLAPHRKPKLDKAWMLGISRPCWTTSFAAGARSRSQLYSKAREVCIWRWISSLISAWFFPDSSVNYPVLLCRCSDRQDRDFVIRSLPSYGVPAAFHRQLSSRGWGSFAFTMLHTALNCVEKAKYCRPDAAFPLPFISLESNFTPGMALCSC